MHPHIAGNTRNERHVKGLRGLHLSHSQPQPKLRRPGGHRCAHPAQWKYMVSNEVCLVQEHPKISSKAIYRNGCGCGVSTMETILLPKHYQAYRRLICVNIVRRSYHCMHCSWRDRHFMEERNKIHSFNTWDWIGGRKSRGKNAKRHDGGKR